MFVLVSAIIGVVGNVIGRSSFCVLESRSPDSAVIALAPESFWTQRLKARIVCLSE